MSGPARSWWPWYSVLRRARSPLEDSLALWERGEALAQRCQTWLDEARARLAAVAQEDPED
ncbi:exodeoxyribonuclease VII small subunit [Actinomyces oris]|uniref:exodeoxyribonuclease VII small subunit n=1 Tax=Actinomyces oris TaxID=544580 RepID=UPI0002003AB2|nr:exodeoxyribonuclease VII small subunit [Actinomyces oris]